MRDKIRMTDFTTSTLLLPCWVIAVMTTSTTCGSSIPSYNTSRCVGLETEQGVIWFRIEKGPLHLVADQYFKLEQLDGGAH